MSRRSKLILGAVLALCLMGAAGVPSRLRVLALGVGTSAPSQNGSIATNATVNGSLDINLDNDSNGTGNAGRVTISSGDGNAALFVSGSGRTSTIVTGGPTGAQAVLRTLGAYPLILGTNNTARATLSSAGVLDLTADPTVNGDTITPTLCATTGGCTVNSLAAGKSIILAKGSTTNRASTTTLAADPDLVITFGAGAAGNYAFEFCLKFTNTTTTAQGYKFSFDRASGSSVGGYTGVASVGAATAQAFIGNGLASFAAPGMVVAVATGAGGGDSACGAGYFTAAAAQYGFSWAQNSSSANNTSLLASSSWIRFDRLN